MANPDSEQPLRSRTVYRGRLFHVRRDTVRTADERAVVREVVEHPGAVAVLPFLDAEIFLLVSQYRYAVGARLLEVPAGTLQPGEPPVRCARRELEEETGYTARLVQRVRSFYLAPGYSTERLHLFEARGLRRTGQRLEADEQIKIVKLPQSRLRATIERGLIRDAKSLVALLPYAG